MPDMAADHRQNRAASSASGGSAASRNDAAFGAIRTLRALLVGSIVAPLLFGTIEGYFSLRASHQRAAATLAEAVAVAAENTAKILDTHALVAARIDDLLAGLSDADIRAQ